MCPALFYLLNLAAKTLAAALCAAPSGGKWWVGSTWCSPTWPQCASGCATHPIQIIQLLKSWCRWFLGGADRAMVSKLEREREILYIYIYLFIYLLWWYTLWFWCPKIYIYIYMYQAGCCWRSMDMFNPYCGWWNWIWTAAYFCKWCSFLDARCQKWTCKPPNLQRTRSRRNPSSI